MNPFPKLGLVTVLYKSVGVLPGFFDSLRVQTYRNIILYVIDNSPDSASLDCARQHGESLPFAVQFIKNERNFGVAKGNNQGIELALNDHCDYILLLNNDIEFPANTIADLVHFALIENAQIAVPKIFYHDTNRLWYAGGSMNRLFGTGIHWGDRSLDEGQFDNVRVVSYAPTCFMLISQQVFREIGLMDENYFVYFDDTDFAYRVNKKYTIIYNPSCEIHHKVSFSSGGVDGDRMVARFWRNSMRLSLKRFSFSGYLNIRNHMYFIKKHYGLLFGNIVRVLVFLRYLFGIVLYDDQKLTRIRILFKASQDSKRQRIEISNEQFM